MSTEKIPTYELADEAFAIWVSRKLSRDQSPISPVRATGIAFKKYGRRKILTLSSVINDTNVASTMNDYVKGLDANERDHLAYYWSAIVTGIVYPRVDETPGSGWSTTGFLAEYNEAFIGTHLPRINLEDLKKGTNVSDELFSFAVNDKLNTITITECLIEHKKPEYYFENVNRLSELKPLFLILAKHNNVFTKSILETAESFKECVSKIKERGNNGKN